MREKNSYLRAIEISIFVIIISIFNFQRLTGSQCIRAIHMVTLLVWGMAIGVFLNNLFAWLKKSN
jgi:hypothetical protein